MILMSSKLVPWIVNDSLRKHQRGQPISSVHSLPAKCTLVGDKIERYPSILLYIFYIYKYISSIQPIVSLIAVADHMVQAAH